MASTTRKYLRVFLLAIDGVFDDEGSVPSLQDSTSLPIVRGESLNVNLTKK
jgi:hypothetical protein